jgi:hypothetical protein
MDIWAGISIVFGGFMTVFRTLWESNPWLVVLFAVLLLVGLLLPIGRRRRRARY